jgi:hypothetical protein
MDQSVIVTVDALVAKRCQMLENFGLENGKDLAIAVLHGSVELKR